MKLWFRQYIWSVCIIVSVYNKLSRGWVLWNPAKPSFSIFYIWFLYFKTPVVIEPVIFQDVCTPMTMMHVKYVMYSSFIHHSFIQIFCNVIRWYLCCIWGKNCVVVKVRSVLYSRLDLCCIQGKIRLKGCVSQWTDYLCQP